MKKFQTIDAGTIRARGTYVGFSGIYQFGSDFTIEYNATASRWELNDTKASPSMAILYFAVAGSAFPLMGWEIENGDFPPPTFSDVATP